MDITLNLKQVDAELIISNLGQAVRDADAEADKYHDMNEKSISRNAYQIELLSIAISRLDDEAIGSIMKALKEELAKIKSKKPEDKDDVDRFDDFVDMIVGLNEYSTEEAKSMYMHDELQAILVSRKK
jgi:hypothetical protein